MPSITPRFTHYLNLTTILNQQFRFDQSATVEFKLGFELVRYVERSDKTYSLDGAFYLTLSTFLLSKKKT